MKTILIITLCLLSIFGIQAQNKLLRLEDGTTGRRYFMPTNLTNLKWRNLSDFTYVDGNKELIVQNVANDEKISILKLEDLNKLLKEKGLEYQQYIYDYTWTDPKNLLIEYDDKYISYNVEKQTINFAILLPENAKNARFCSAISTLAYTIKNNLFIADKAGNTQQITNDSDPGIVNGDSYVHRQEFGIDNGIFWSPKGNLMAFYRKDETMVANYPLVDIDTRIASLNNIKYPMAGETSEQVTLGIYNLKTGKTIFLKTGEPKDHYLTRISWDPGEKYIYVAELNREQNHMKLNKYDVLSGDFISTLFEEKNPKYVEPLHDMIFLKIKPDLFVWQSNRDGYNHLYLYDTTGKLVKQLTSGNYEITEYLGFDQKEENYYVESTMESPIERHLYKFNLKTGKMMKLTNEKGTHNTPLSPDGKYFVTSFSSTTVPRKIELMDGNGKMKKELLTSPDPLKDYKLGEMQINTIKSADNKTDLYCRIIKPLDFDSTKKYPVIVYVYGGPHVQLINNTWLGGTGLWDYYMAQKGYIIFTLDSRGSGNRGFDFESVIHRQLGVEEMKDQMKGIEYLESKPWVDQSRIGVYGWSFGGFMTISLKENYPETFKVGVSGGPVTDWKYYEVMYGERYMDTPRENPEGYANSSTLEKTKNLKGRLLVIHGTIDPVVVWQNSQEFVKSCVDNQILIDYFIYPGHEHNVQGKDRLHLMKKITQYFDDFL